MFTKTVALSLGLLCLTGAAPAQKPESVSPMGLAEQVHQMEACDACENQMVRVQRRSLWAWVPDPPPPRAVRLRAARADGVTYLRKRSHFPPAPPLAPSLCCDTVVRLLRQ